MDIRQIILDIVQSQKYKGMDASHLSRELKMEDAASFTKLMKCLTCPCKRSA